MIEYGALLLIFAPCVCARKRRTKASEMVNIDQDFRFVVSRWLVEAEIWKFDLEDMRSQVELLREDITVGDIPEHLTGIVPDLDAVEPEHLAQLNVYETLKVFSDAQMDRVFRQIIPAEIAILDSKTELDNCELFKCPICDFDSLGEETWGYFCVCGWIDGAIDSQGISSVNKDIEGKSISLNSAKENWRETGSIRLKHRKSFELSNHQKWAEFFISAYPDRKTPMFPEDG